MSRQKCPGVELSHLPIRSRALLHKRIRDRSSNSRDQNERGTAARRSAVRPFPETLVGQFSLLDEIVKLQPRAAQQRKLRSSMIEIPKPQSYDSLRKQLRGVVTDLLDRVRDQAANEAERREIIDLYVAQITEIIEDTAMTTEQAFGIIDMIAADLKSDWEEMRASEPISRAAARKT
jgi:hypothetical protein